MWGQRSSMAKNFTPYTNKELKALADRVREQATDGRHEWFKSMQTFDSQYHRDQHGFRGPS